MVNNKELYPALSEDTIYRRLTRNMNLLGEDYPLVETGEWLTFIEFRITEVNGTYKLEVGVWDTATRIGHSKDADPVWIATANEYGYLNTQQHINIPARKPFATSELKMLGVVDQVLMDTWVSLEGTLSQDLNVYVTEIGGSSTLHGRIILDGRTFKFVWD